MVHIICSMVTQTMSWKSTWRQLGNTREDGHYYIHLSIQRVQRMCYISKYHLYWELFLNHTMHFNETRKHNLYLHVNLTYIRWTVTLIKGIWPHHYIHFNVKVGIVSVMTYIHRFNKILKMELNFINLSKFSGCIERSLSRRFFFFDVF